MSSTLSKARQIAERDLLQKPELNENLRPLGLKRVIELRNQDRKLEAIAPKTGYDQLDAMIKGFIPGRLYTLTGETNAGKTSMACNFACNVAAQKKSVLYFALEPDRALIDYLVSVSRQKRFSQVTPEDTVKFGGHISFYGADQVKNLETLVDVVERLERYDLIVIDHIGYFVSANSSNFYAQQGDVLKQLALLAQRKSSAILLIAHLNKTFTPSEEHWIPNMNQISGSGAFKQDSDDVLVLARKPEKDQEYEGIMHYTDFGGIFVNKTKAGRSGMCPLEFHEDSALITERDGYEF